MNSTNRYYTPNLKKLKREKTTLSSNNSSDSEKKDSVQVYCRIRPLTENGEPTNCIKVLSADTLAVITPETRAQRKEVHHKFKHIFTSYSSQSEIFSHVTYPLLENLLHGKNGLLFTYGVTGSGKTYTLTGEKTDPGIMPRSIYTIFNTVGQFQAPKCVIKSDRMNGFEVQTEDDAMRDRLQAVRNFGRTPRANRKPINDKLSYVNDGIKIQGINETSLYAVFVSYVEIYNNNVYDLLDESTRTLENKILREDCYRNMYVNGVVELEVKTAQEAFEAFNAGQSRKRMASTALNSDSSRSHSIFNIRVVQLEQVTVNGNGQIMIPKDNMIKVGQLSLVDLAGSERTNRTNNTGMRLKEASRINNSLMTLRTCLEILRENELNNGNRLVPYRDSRLTCLFKHYFEGDGTVKMIVCLNPSLQDFDENMQVLKFAEMSQDVKVNRAEVKYTALKKTITRNKESQTPSKPKSASSYALLPEISLVKFNFEAYTECAPAVEKVIKILKLRRTLAKNTDKEIEEKQAELRRKMVALDQEVVLTRAEVKSLKIVIHKEKQKSRNMQLKVSDLEATKQDLHFKNQELQDAVHALRNTIQEKDLKINQKILEKERTEQKLALKSEILTQEFDAKLRRQRDHLNAAMKGKEQKLKLVKEIIDSEMRPTELNSGATEQDYAVKSMGSQVPQTPKSSSTLYQHRRNQTPASSRPRRSRSAGEVWLEHNVIKPCPLSTVMQPTMKKRKSVSKLDKASDVTNPKQSKYCLVSQEPDTDGEMETKLYKADIVPTCGGGAQVIFNDVERLRQESPTRGEENIRR